MDRETEHCELVIFTTFDSSLFDLDNESYQTTLETIQTLQNAKITLILVTNKTYQEIADLRQRFNLQSPIVVEHGSGIMIPQNCLNFSLEQTRIEGEYNIKQLGCSYVEARAALKVIQSLVRINNLKGFGDLSEKEIELLTKLSLKEAKQAKTREFSEIFITPQDVDPQEIISTAEEFGFQALIGDRLSCLIGAEASIQKAIEWLKTNYQPSQNSTKVITIGLGVGSEDLEMLEAVDIPFVIRNNAEINSSLEHKGWRTTEATGIAGWVEAIKIVFEQLKPNN